MLQEPRLELHASVDALREELQEVRRQSEAALLEQQAELRQEFESTTGPIREELARLTELTRCLGGAGSLPDGPERTQQDLSSLQDAAEAPHGGPLTNETAAELQVFAENPAGLCVQRCLRPGSRGPLKAAQAAGDLGVDPIVAEPADAVGLARDSVVYQLSLVHATVRNDRPDVHCPEPAETVASIRGELAQVAEMLSGAQGLAQSVLGDISGFREEVRALQESHRTALSAALEQLHGKLLEEMKAMIDERQQAIVDSQLLLPTSSPVKPQALIHCFNSLTADAADSLGRSTPEVADGLGRRRPLRGEPVLETNVAEGLESSSGRRELEGLGELSGDECASDDDDTILPWLPHGLP